MSNVKTAFTTRFGEDGRIIEFDYRQLEIRVLALATRSYQLIEDINNDIDLHKYFASQIYDKAESQVTDQERKLAKGFSFQLQYGAGAKSISEFWHVDKKLVESFIEAYYSRYPEVKDWQDDNIERCKHEAQNLGKRSPPKPDGTEGEPIHTTFVPNIWGFTGPVGSFMLDGKIWINYRGQAEEKFSPTQIKNYPIQGGAADIVLLMLTQLQMSGLVAAPGLRFINTVHDSFVFDYSVRRGRYHTLAEIKDLLESVPEVLESTLGVVSPVSFPVDVSVGDNWGNTKEVTLLDIR